MKKTILAMIIAGSSAAVCAQDTTTMKDTRMDSAQNMTGTQTSTGDYSAYGTANMPTMIQRNFQAQYPSATDAQWQQTYNGFWRATYRQSGQLMTIHYAPNGESFMVALPVLQSNVPQDIVNRALELYGNNLYDITLVKLPNPEAAAMDSMMRADMSRTGNADVKATTDTSAMTADTSTMGVTADANTYGTWDTDTAGRASIPRTIDLYLVRIIDNGILRAQRMNADGTPDLAYGTTMAAPISSNVNVNNMNQNGTANINRMNTNPPAYSAYYNYGSDSAGATISTGNYAAKDSVAVNPSVDTTATTPITDTTTTSPITDTTATSPVIDTTSINPVTDTTSNSSTTNPTGDPNTTTNDAKLNNESGSTGTGTNVNSDMNTNKKNKKKNKNKNSNNTSGY